MTAFILVILLPLTTFISILLFGRKLGTYGSSILGCCNITIAWLVSVGLMFLYSFEYTAYIEVFEWVNILGQPIKWSFKYDALTAIMFVVVTTVASGVHLYSTVYMYTDPYLSRFISYLSLFSAFMIVLVSAGNFLVLFVGWEGVGLSSYLLIGFWYTRAQAGKAATKAFLVNKIGDIFLLAGISMIFIVFHTVEFSGVSVLAAFQSKEILEVISIFLFIGAVGKSAQIGLHTWLPDAMEGPTPVSALIHAATMVTAGVFLIIRSSMILEYVPDLLALIGLLGGLTALISGTIGTAQNDMKKIIAYSTCSQLGYMVLACGISAYDVSLFHLFNHAFFKALLFLSAGSVIHLMAGEQDIRKMGGLATLMPSVYINTAIASLALSGFPFLSGFFSKDIIIEGSNIQLFLNNSIVYWAAIVSAALTISYSMRLLSSVFWGHYQGHKKVIQEYSPTTVFEMILLGIFCILSMVSGFFFKDMFIGLGANYFNNAISNYQENSNSPIETEFLPAEIKLLPLLLTFFSFELQIRFLECKWFYNEVVNGYITLPALVLSKHAFEQYEKRCLDLNGPLYIVATVKECINYRG